MIRSAAEHMSSNQIGVNFRAAPALPPSPSSGTVSAITGGPLSDKITAWPTLGPARKGSAKFSPCCRSRNPDKCRRLHVCKFAADIATGRRTACPRPAPHRQARHGASGRRPSFRGRDVAKTSSTLTTAIYAGDNFKGCAACADSRALRKAEGLGAVKIATPDHHGVISMAAMKRHRHVILHPIANRLKKRA